MYRPDIPPVVKKTPPPRPWQDDVYVAKNTNNPESHLLQLWDDHTFETLMFVMSTVNEQDILANDVLRMLMMNQVLIALAFRRVLPGGERDAKTLAGLLKEHIKLAGDVVTAVIKKADVAPPMAEWKRNADQVGAMFNSVWPKCVKKEHRIDFKKHMQHHLERLTATVVQVVANTSDPIWLHLQMMGVQQARDMAHDLSVALTAGLRARSSS